MIEVEIEDRFFRNLLRAIKEPVSIRVGILGSKDGRNGKTSSNATVGAAHEFGTSRMPRRSFLVDPLKEHLNEFIEKSGAFSPELAGVVLRSGSSLEWVKKLATLAEAVILEAFSSRGFGKWTAWSKGYSNQTGTMLVDTQQLRNSITSEVKVG